MQVKSTIFYIAILSSFIKLQIEIKIFVLSIFEWPFYTGFTVCIYDSDLTLEEHDMHAQFDSKMTMVY